MPFQQPATILLKNSRTTTVAETTMMVRGSPTQVIYKRFNRKKWLDPLLTLFRPSRAWRSWQAGQDLASRGIPTPQNLAFLSRRRPFKKHPFFWFLPHETYLITVKEENVVDLATYASKVLPSLPPDARRARIRSLTVALAELVRSLHERSLSHRDLKASNILINCRFDRRTRSAQPDRPGRGSSAASASPGSGASRTWRVSASVWMPSRGEPGPTSSDSSAFIFPGACRRLNDWKGFWRSIERAIRTKRSRNLRRRRPLS